MYTTTQQFTLQPLYWMETVSATGIKRVVATSLSRKLVIHQSTFDKTYDVDVHTECTTWNLHFGCRTLEEAKELAWKSHCKQLRDCLLPVDLFQQLELL